MMRFELVNSRVGSWVQERADPIGIDEVAKQIKRSEEFGGIFHEIILDVKFIKGYRDFVKQCYETDGGIDAKIICNLYQYNPNTFKMELYATGQANLNTADIGEADFILVIEQTGIQRTILNMMETDVNLETDRSEDGSVLPVQDVRSAIWHSKTLIKASKTKPSNSNAHQELGAVTLNLAATGDTENRDLIVYVQLENESAIQEELDDSFSTPYGATHFPGDGTQDDITGAGSEAEYVTFLSEEDNKPIRNPRYVAKESGVMDVELQLRYKHKVEADNVGGDIDVDGGSGCLGTVEVTAWYEHRSSTNAIKTLQEIGRWTMSAPVSDSSESGFETKNLSLSGVVVEVGDKFYTYCVYRIYGSYQSPALLTSAGSAVHDFTIEAEAGQTFFNLSSRTVFPETEVSFIMIYEAFERCLQYYTNEVDCFKSDLLGRTDRGYAADGKWSMVAWNNGNWIRGRKSDVPFLTFTSKKLFTNLKELIQFVNSIGCVSVGFEVIDGKEKFVLEPIEYFYDKNTRIISLTTTDVVRKRVDADRYFNQFIWGYEGKLDISQANAIDEFNVLRKKRIPLVNTKNKLDVSTKVRTSGYQIETLRRLVTSSEDHNLDNEKFATIMIRDGDEFKPAKNENYTQINNVFQPENGYNFDFHPARTAPNWYPVIAANLIRATRAKLITPANSEGNDQMSTIRTGEADLLAEDSVVDLTSIEAIWDPEIYYCNGPLNSELMKLVDANPKGYIEIIDQHGEILEGFINNKEGIKHFPEKKMASFELLKVYRP